MVSKQNSHSFKELRMQSKKIIRELAKTLKNVELLLDKYFSNVQNDNQDFVRKINTGAFVAKILEINIEFLKEFSKIYGKSFTSAITISRSIFELHLIFVEAISSEINFLELMVRTNLANESFIDKFLQIAAEKGDMIAMNALMDEHVRIGLLRKKYEKMLNFKSKKQLSGYHKFRKLAKKANLLDVYNIEYNILSSFIHPSLMYITSTKPRDKTISKEMRERAEFNVESRKKVVEKLAINVAFGMSLKTNSKAIEILNQY